MISLTHPPWSCLSRRNSSLSGTGLESDPVRMQASDMISQGQPSSLSWQQPSLGDCVRVSTALRDVLRLLGTLVRRHSSSSKISARQSLHRSGLLVEAKYDQLASWCHDTLERTLFVYGEQIG